MAYYAPLPVPTATPGIVTLVNYWIGSKQARPGQTVSVDYVIDNATGTTVRLFLGASIKSVRTPTWTEGVINDPPHDVVATVPPGVTIHLRYFTLPPTLRPGLYDVAWGLRDPVSGERLALVAAKAILAVTR